MAADSPGSSKSGGEGSVKETIESILVAFILAFVFRAFVVEAFVIPTGSMGPTLMGAHMRFVCPDCGYHYEVNFPSKDGDGTDIPATTTLNADLTCPNCGFVSSYHNAIRPVYFGDRILVLKYRYLFRNPNRWDVVVFKSPYERNRDPTDPKYSDNYIKRLIAEPNEAVMVLDGDVYIGVAGEIDPLKLKIQRKPDYVQNASWRVVYDNDYLPQGKPRLRTWRQPWVIDGGSGWTGPRAAGDDAGTTGGDRIFRFANSTAAAAALTFDSEANTEAHPLTDWLAYNQSQPINLFPVSDLKLNCVYTRTSGSGPLRLQLTKRDDCFTAEITPNHVALIRTKVVRNNPLRVATQNEWKLEETVPELNGNAPTRVELENVDYRVTVRINGRAVLSTTEEQYAPDLKSLTAEFRQHSNYPSPDLVKPTVRIEASNQACTIEHLSLWRDIYYLNNGSRLDPTAREHAGPFWASPDNIMQLGPDEYFVMGDNSQVSLDARWWGAPVNLPAEGINVEAGRVPRGFMLGKAFFVYWPAGYRPLNLQFGIIPDFGDMRFIH